ncbi:hypothetical protein BH18ACT4_BH18ACT4_01300 [soil metagenome]
MVPPVELPRWAMLSLDVAVWGGWSALAGWWAHLRPAGRFSTDGWLPRPRRWESDGRFYRERLGVRRWKDRLPEAGALFAGGFSKRALRSTRRDDLERFGVETRRAEWAHWLIMAAAPVFFLWNWWWVDLIMVAYALAANLPCVAVQRYNRARLTRVLERRRPS